MVAEWEKAAEMAAEVPAHRVRVSPRKGHVSEQPSSAHSLSHRMMVSPRRRHESSLLGEGGDKIEHRTNCMKSVEHSISVLQKRGGRGVG